MKQDRCYHPFTWPCLQEAFPRHYSHVLLAWLQSLLFGPKFGVPITHRPNQISRLFRYILWNHPCLIILCGADVFLTLPIQVKISVGDLARPFSRLWLLAPISWNTWDPPTGCYEFGSLAAKETADGCVWNGDILYMDIIWYIQWQLTMIYSTSHPPVLASGENDDALKLGIPH